MNKRQIVTIWKQSNINDIKPGSQANNIKAQVKFGILPQIFEANCYHSQVEKNFNIESTDHASHRDEAKNDSKPHGHSHGSNGHQDLLHEKLDGIEAFCDSQSCNKLFVINHTGRIYKFWNKIICYLCLLSSFYFISCAANIRLDYRDHWENVLCESLFLVDFIAKFFLSYQDPKNPTGRITDIE